MKLPPFKLERYFAHHEFTAPFHLCASDCESVTVGELLALEPDAAGRFSNLRLTYTEPLGSPELREAVATGYSTLDRAHILVHTGAEEAIFNFMNVVLRPGDEVVVQTPCYQSLAEVARASGAVIKNWYGNPEQNYHFEPQALFDLIDNRTRLVVINAPHNPTGFLPDHAVIQELVALAERFNFRIFSDEVYRGLELDHRHRLPALADLTERAVSLGVMSKAYGLAGLRIGWLASRDRDLLERLAAFKDYTTICNSGPSEFLAEIALRHGEVLINRNLELIRRNLELLDGFFSDYPDRFCWYRPTTGPICFPRLKHGDAEDFCSRLLESAGVLLLPGTLYGPYHDSFRIGFGRRNLDLGLAAFRRFLEQN